MISSKTIQICGKVAEEYNKKMAEVFSKLRNETLRAEIHHDINTILNSRNK